MPEIKGDYQGRLKTIKATADAKLETVSAIEAGTNVIGNIDRVATVGQIDHLGTVEYVKEIDNLGTVGRLETLGMIEGGTISEVVHVGTVGDITHLGSIGNVNRIESLGTIGDINHLGSIGNTAFDQGAVSYPRRHMYAWSLTSGTWMKVYRNGNSLLTDPGWTGATYGPLLTDAEYRLKLATLGTVERVKEIDNIGTVGKSKTHIEQYGTQVPLQGTAHGAYTVPKAERLGVLYNLRPNRDRDLVTAPGWTGSRRVKLLTDDDWQLKTAPARSRKGVVQTVANAGTAVALVASSTPAIGVIVKAEHENLGTIYVGDSTVDDTHGFLLRRDEFISFSCQNAGSVFIDASRNAQKVSALYINY